MFKRWMQGSRSLTALPSPPVIIRTQVVTVTVNGANDTPTIANAIVDQSGTEDGIWFCGTCKQLADVDADDSLSYSATLQRLGITELVEF